MTRIQRHRVAYLLEVKFWIAGDQAPPGVSAFPILPNRRVNHIGDFNLSPECPALRAISSAHPATPTGEERGATRQNFGLEDPVRSKLVPPLLPHVVVAHRGHQAFSVPDYEPLLPGDYKRFFGVPDSLNWYGTLRVQLSPDDSSEDLTMVDPRLLDLLSIRYYVDGRFPHQVLYDPYDKRSPRDGKISRRRAGRIGDALGAGHHQVDLSYEPASARYGSILTALGLLALAIIAVAEAARAVRRRSAISEAQDAR